MGTFSVEKVPIPLFNNHSYKTAPSYSLYGLFHRQNPKTPLRETATHFLQAVTPCIPRASSWKLVLLIRTRGWSPTGPGNDWFSSRGTILSTFHFQAIKSKIGSFEPSLETLEQPALYLSVISSCLAFLG